MSISYFTLKYTEGLHMCLLDNIESIFKQISDSTPSKEIDRLLEDLYLIRACSVLEDVLQKDKNFQESNHLIESKLEILSHCNLTCKQQNAVDDVFSAYNFNSSEYGRNAYIQGFKDAITLFMQIYSPVLFNNNRVKHYHRSSEVKGQGVADTP